MHFYFTNLKDGRMLASTNVEITENNIILTMYDRKTLTLPKSEVINSIVSHRNFKN